MSRVQYIIGYFGHDGVLSDITNSSIAQQSNIKLPTHNSK